MLYLRLKKLKFCEGFWPFCFLTPLGKTSPVYEVQYIDNYSGDYTICHLLVDRNL